MARPCCFRYPVSPAVMRRRVAQGQADQEPCMFEALAEFARLPLAPSNAACPERQRRADESGSPFFWVLFFGEAKKSASPAGARPGSLAQSRKQADTNPTPQTAVNRPTSGLASAACRHTTTPPT